MGNNIKSDTDSHTGTTACSTLCSCSPITLPCCWHLSLSHLPSPLSPLLLLCRRLRKDDINKFYDIKDKLGTSAQHGIATHRDSSLTYSV